MARPKSTDGTKDRRLTLRVGDKLHKGLLLMSDNNERKVSATIRTLLVEAIRARKAKLVKPTESKGKTNGDWIDGFRASDLV